MDAENKKNLANFLLIFSCFTEKKVALQQEYFPNDNNKPADGIIEKLVDIADKDDNNFCSITIQHPIMCGF